MRFKMNLEKILFMLFRAEKRARQDYDNAQTPNLVHFYRGRMEAYQMAIEIINENIESEKKITTGGM